VARDRLLTTGEAARALSIDRSTLARWERDGVVTPAFKTAGGHSR
jgi:DNA-binding transcriptional MerR regulator